MRAATAALAAAMAMAWAGQAVADPAGLRVDGAVQHDESFTLDQLKALPAQHVDGSFRTMHGLEHGAWTGVLLWDLVGKAGLKDEAGKRTGLRHTLLVHGKDGYAVALSIGEIEPSLEDKPVIIAYQQDGTAGDLPGLRLVIPGDKKGARQVHDVVEVEVR